MTIDMTWERREQLIRRDEREAGREEGREMLLATLVKDGILTLEKAAEYMVVTEEEFEKIMKAE